MTTETKIIAGIDEVGRGPLAGPVMAAAVVLQAARPIDGLTDSKMLTAKRRETLYAEIMLHAHVGIGEASVEEIEEINILAASHLAMRRALAALPVRPTHCLVDGNRDPKLGLPTELIIKGDLTVPAISAASIIAKVTRDRLMKKLAKSFPAYGWETNAGYGTRRHLDALDLVGPSPHHRKSFAPIAQLSFKSLL